jgi:hypothetical protein
MHNQETMFQYIRNRNEHSASLLLFLLLSVDFAFIVLHIMNKATRILNPQLFSIEKDNTYPEFYQYIKFLWIIILFSYVLKSTKHPSYISWILTFVYFLCDDALKIHEMIGGYIAKSFDFHPPLNLRLQDFGELTVSATIGALLLAIFVGAYLHGSQTFKKVSKDMLLFIAALVFFGVFVDMVHIAIELGPVVRFGLGITEDGGEMVVVSLILWYVFLLAIRDGDSDLFLHDLLRKPLARRCT